MATLSATLPLVPASTSSSSDVGPTSPPASIFESHNLPTMAHSSHHSGSSNTASHPVSSSSASHHTTTSPQLDTHAFTSLFEKSGSTTGSINRSTTVVSALDSIRPVIKLRLGDQIKRIPLPKSELATLSFSDLKDLIKKHFKTLGQSPLNLKYKDSEGDWVILEDDLDLSNAIALSPILNVRISLDINACNVDSFVSIISSYKPQLESTVGALREMLILADVSDNKKPSPQITESSKPTESNYKDSPTMTTSNIPILPATGANASIPQSVSVLPPSQGIHPTPGSFSQPSNLNPLPPSTAPPAATSFGQATFGQPPSSSSSFITPVSASFPAPPPSQPFAGIQKSPFPYPQPPMSGPPAPGSTGSFPNQPPSTSSFANPSQTAQGFPNPPPSSSFTGPTTPKLQSGYDQQSFPPKHLSSPATQPMGFNPPYPTPPQFGQSSQPITSLAQPQLANMAPAGQRTMNITAPPPSSSQQPQPQSQFGSQFHPPPQLNQQPLPPPMPQSGGGPGNGASIHGSHPPHHSNIHANAPPHPMHQQQGVNPLYPGYQPPPAFR